MGSSRIRNHFRFALKKEKMREAIPHNQIEKLGDLLSWGAYGLPKMGRNCFGNPRFLTLFFTLFFMAITSLLFYPSRTADILFDTFLWPLRHLPWSYLRFTLWFFSELTIVGLGIRAFGRFSNPQLMKFHGIA